MKKTTLRKLTEIEDATLKRLQWEADVMHWTLDELLEREDGRRFHIYVQEVDGEIYHILFTRKNWNEVKKYGEFGSRAYTYGK